MTSYVKPNDLNKVGYAPVTARNKLEDKIKAEITAAEADILQDLDQSQFSRRP